MSDKDHFSKSKSVAILEVNIIHSSKVGLELCAAVDCSDINVEKAKTTLKKNVREYDTMREVAALLTVEQKLDLENQLLRAAESLKARLSEIPFFAQRAAKDPNYWRELASSAVNIGE